MTALNLSYSYWTLRNHYNSLYTTNQCFKHSTHDSTFFIVLTEDGTYSVIKFYNDGIDYRSATSFGSLAEAYSMALSVL